MIWIADSWSATKIISLAAYDQKMDFFVICSEGDLENDHLQTTYRTD